MKQRKQANLLNLGRYVGVVDTGGGYDGDFEEKVKNLYDEFKILTDETHKLEEKIFENLKRINY